MGTSPSTTRRPTRADLHEAEERASLLLAQVDELRARLQVAEFDRDSWRAEHVDVPEAECLAGCIRAIDKTLGEHRSDAPAQTDGLTFGTGGNLELLPTLRTPSDESPVGRVLLHLADRYGVDLTAKAER